MIPWAEAFVRSCPSELLLQRDAMTNGCDIRQVTDLLFFSFPADEPAFFFLRSGSFDGFSEFAYGPKALTERLSGKLAAPLGGSIRTGLWLTQATARK